jgi:orotate phosphoribosyltransferase-like protein
VNALKRGGAKPVDGRVICSVMELRKQGLTQMAIAAELRLAQGTVSVILREQGMGGKLVRMSRAERRRL